MALWELTSVLNDEAVNCDFCEAENLDTWYPDNDNNKNSCLPCVWNNERKGASNECGM